MLVESGRLLHIYEQIPHPDYGLGRHLELDSRSLDYTVERTLGKPVVIKPAEHLPSISTLDQGHLGSCTGNAGTYGLSALYGAAGLSKLTLDGKTLGADALTNEMFAVALYHEATVQDGIPGEYPPDDLGSTGLGVCKALKAVGLISRYLWATTSQGVGTLLQTQGVIVGVPWYQNFFQPDSHGFVDTPGWENSGIAGGHEIYWEALEAWNGRDSSKSVIRFRNSWSSSWGDHGCGRMRLSTYERLKQQIDVKQLVH